MREDKATVRQEIALLMTLDEMLLQLREALPALGRAERAERVMALRLGAPPEILMQILEGALRPLLPPDEWADLARRLGADPASFVRQSGSMLDWTEDLRESEHDQPDAPGPRQHLDRRPEAADRVLPRHSGA